MSQRPMLLFEIKSINNLIKRQVAGLFSHDSSDLTAMQGFVLGYLHKNGDKEVFQRDVETEFHIRRSTATGILQLLEKNAWIERRPVARDARLKKLVLTPKAIAHHEKFMAKINEIERIAVQGLDEEEILACLSVLAKIKKNIE